MTVSATADACYRAFCRSSVGYRLSFGGESTVFEGRPEVLQGYPAEGPRCLLTGQSFTLSISDSSSAVRCVILDAPSP